MTIVNGTKHSLTGAAKIPAPSAWVPVPPEPVAPVPVTPAPVAPPVVAPTPVAFAPVINVGCLEHFERPCWGEAYCPRPAQLTDFE